MKCPNCNAPIKYDSDEKKLFECEYCHSEFLNSSANETPVSAGTQSKQDFTPPPKAPESPKPNIPKRPKLSIFWTVILFCCYVWPGVLYLSLTLYNIHKWDEKYGKML